MTYHSQGEQLAREELGLKVLPALSTWITLYDSGEKWHLTRSLIALAKVADLLAEDEHALDDFLRQRSKSNRRGRRVVGF